MVYLCMCCEQLQGIARSRRVLRPADVSALSRGSVPRPGRGGAECRGPRTPAPGSLGHLHLGAVKLVPEGNIKCTRMSFMQMAALASAVSLCQYSHRICIVPAPVWTPSMDRRRGTHILLPISDTETHSNEKPELQRRGENC